ncbi:conserved hypothetical protein [Microsporum canis CBS 113480]|uniref:Altered inheritance of mitochondria protein 9, mitochondrial n=1 Tax=Arthroderma otae (strain ATCC MYA-4605 / CBS 113480) TaxID=554155 RepID=C5FU06_ARTOC|nr:conserved hypothetical protein [Microsporum canis CBS 113480]EEQ33390.1 conserved hypothetical protein [Microsporum canis CBS 113480]
MLTQYIARSYSQYSTVLKTFPSAGHLFTNIPSLTWQLATSRGRQTLGSQARELHTSSSPNIIEPNRHSTGGWLHQDRLQREARYTKLDFDALCEQAVRLFPGSSGVAHCEKIEGGFNRTFILTLDCGSKVVARVPTSVAGPPKLATSSEVATMNCCQWETMDTVQQLECTKTLMMMAKQLADLNFPAYGCLYFQDAPLPDGSRIPFTKDYFIGPHCASTYWKCGVGETLLYGDDIPDCGPWGDLLQFCQGLIKTGFSRLPKSNTQKRAAYKGSVDEHIRLIQDAEMAISHLIQHPLLKEAGSPLLLHPGFHKRNIFVSESDPTIVTGVIDWQSTSIQPAFMYVMDVPDFASLPDDLPFLKKFVKLPEEDEYNLKAASICAQAYDVIIKAFIPKLQAARNLDPALYRIFHYCLTSWTSSATAVREELIDLFQNWRTYDIPGCCPYSISEEQVAAHKKMYIDFEDSMKLKAGLMRLFNTNPDGYMANDEWKKAYEALPMLREEWIASAVESGTTEEDAMEMFPFDGR